MPSLSSLSKGRPRWQQQQKLLDIKSHHVPQLHSHHGTVHYWAIGCKQQRVVCDIHTVLEPHLGSDSEEAASSSFGVLKCATTNVALLCVPCYLPPQCAECKASITHART